MRFKKTYAIVAHDSLMCVVAWQLGWWLRFNLDFPFFNWQLSLYTLPIVFFVQSLAFWRFRLYKGIWRFASLPDLWNIFRASIIGALSITLVLFMWFRLEGIPRSILVLYPILLMFLLGGSRLTYRIWKDRSLNLNRKGKATRVLIVGAGSAGEMLIRDILREGQYMPVGFVDDELNLHGSEIHGVRVLGDIEDIPCIFDERDIDIIIIAVPSASNAEMQRILKYCEKTRCALRTLPSMRDMVSGRVSLNQLREVLIEDLLGREKVQLNWQAIQKGIAGKKVLVTGGGGSIGFELCKQISTLAPAELMIYERNEYNLYRAEQTLKDSNIQMHFVLADVCDKRKIDKIFSDYKPDIVFHAAAYKHVPMLERQPREAVKNNVLGTRVVADAANQYNCERFILISTDKAVNPTNMLGASKRAAEMYIESMNGNSKTTYMTVRFGNVLDSEGSVVPLFRKQIKKGGPVTVTHPEVTRYFMTIPEACQLILQAGSMGEGAEIYVLDMGKPVNIHYLAEQMIRLSGLQPEIDIKITHTGLRPGEKMYEELFYENEKREKTEHKKIYIATHKPFDSQQLKDEIKKLLDACERLAEDEIVLILNRIVPLHKKNENNIIQFENKASL